MAVKSLKRAQQRIEIKDLKLNALLEVTVAINSNFSKKKLFAIYEDVLIALQIEKLVLFTQENNWSVALSYGLDKKDINIDVQKDLIPIKNIAEVNDKTDGPFAAYDTIIPVYHKRKPLAYLLIGDVFNEAIKMSPIIKHFPFIQTLTNIIVVALENKTFASEALKQEGIKKELELASEMQNMLLPSHFKSNDFVSIGAFYQSHQEVGGDYYDVMFVDDHRVAFCIADVSGKGMSAAILMSNFQANVRVLTHHASSLKELVSTLNDKVIENANGEKFITMFIGLYDSKTREFSYINCGHNPPVLKANNEIIELTDGCPGLGMLDVLPEPKIGNLILPKDTVITSYTDGLVEVENINQEEFGSERVMDVIKQFNSKDVEKLNSTLMSELNTYRKKQPFIDDIAILSCYFY